MSAFEDFVNIELPQRAAMLTSANTGATGDPNASTLPKVKNAPKGTWFIDDVTGDLWQKLEQSDPTSWTLRASGSGTRFSCPTAVSAGDAVYVSGVGTVALANAGASPTHDAVGIVSYKPSSTEAIVVQLGVVGLYTGLTPGLPVFTNPTLPGKITQTVPTTLGYKVQKLGQAVSASAIIVSVEMSVTL